MAAPAAARGPGRRRSGGEMSAGVRVGARFAFSSLPMLPMLTDPEEKYADFEALFQCHPMPMWVFDDETLEFLAVNDAAIECYGYSREEFLAMTLEQVRPREDVHLLHAYRARTRGMATSGPHRGTTWRHLCRNGAIIEVDSCWSRISFAGRDAVLSVVQDRSAYRHAEERSREQADLLDLASDAIIVCDLEGRITFWNQGATRLYGWTTEEALGAQMVEMIMRDVSALAKTEKGLRERGQWSGELGQKTKDGRHLTVNSRWTLVRNDHGEPKSVLSINTDLTETKKLEAQFLRAQRQESIGTLASGIAHDLNNILSPILMSVAILRRTAGPESERMLGIIESSAERGAGIVKQVLTFARGVEGERVLLQPKHLLSEMSKILAQTFPKNIDLQANYPADLWTVTGDATQLHQVLLNLCVNARDAMGEKGGALTIAAENVDVDEHFARMNPGAQLGPHVVLKVTDNGSGMPPEVMDKIFDPFFTTKEVGKGTGIGLATVIGIVKSHGGFLTVQSEVGVGTTFRVFLPATLSEGTAETAQEREVDLRGNGELILVVDDEPPIREALVQTLEDFGYRAYTAEDGSDALALYFQRRGEIKVVLTDLAMGQMDGLSLVRALRKLDAQVRVIVSSGHCQPEQTIALEKLGVTTFLDKPYNAGKLLRAVRAELDGALLGAR
jgi:two-component system, cell cycle sensor histidine kinase and response regulator CckA